MVDRAIEKTTGLVIIGDSVFAEIAWEYFDAMSPNRIDAFAVERQFLRQERLLGLPVIPLDEMPTRFPPATHHVFAAIVYTELNRLRARLAAAAETMGYTLASFISPHAMVARSAKIGSHCFIFEGNVIQSFVTIGRNTILWSGNHIGHHSRIGENVFVSSHVVISGGCEIGDNCFFGVNSTVANDLRVAEDCWIGPGALISKNTLTGEMHRAPSSELVKISAPRFFKIKPPHSID
jgi:sugar O-acyltransferase (sialic acid O-acetyltransferase NeuD family)